MIACALKDLISLREEQQQQILAINACPRNSFWWYSSSPLVHVAHLTFISDSFVSAVSSSIHFRVPPPATRIFLARVMIIFLTQSTSLSSSHYLMSLRTIFTWLIKSHSFLATPSAPSTKKWNRAGQSDFPLGPSTISHWTSTEHIQAYTIFPPPNLPPTFDKIILAKWNVKR